jgi:hypothetical protein
MAASRAGSLKPCSSCYAWSDPNAKRREQTALWAVAHQQTDVIRALIEGRADVRREKQGVVPAGQPVR